MRRLDLILLAALVLTAIAVVNTQHRARRLFVDLQRERSLGEQLAADWRRLQVDQATLAAANRVERAAASLRMHVPDSAGTHPIQPMLADQAVQPPVPESPPVRVAREAVR